jgi:predicted transport protein
MIVFYNGKQYTEFEYEKEADFEREVVANAKLFFGRNSILIDTKKKIETRALGNSIPDGYLFDLSDRDNPEFYLVEVELAKHDFYKHIFPQVTKYFGFFINTGNQANLVEKIFATITEDQELQKEFKKYLGEKELYKFLKDTIEDSHNILLIIDGDKPELPEITETYADTWGKMLKSLQIKKYRNAKDAVFTMHPDFENIEYVDADAGTKDASEKKDYSEEYHFDGVTDVIKRVYGQLKNELLSVNPSLLFNPQKYYISLVQDKNLAFFKVRKKKIVLVVMMSAPEVKKMINYHSIKPLSDSVQRFYNGKCCAIVIDDDRNLPDVVAVLKKLVSKNAPV